MKQHETGGSGLRRALVLELRSGACCKVPEGLRSKASGSVGNVDASHDLDLMPDRVAAKLANVWADVRLLDTHGIPDRNAPVMAGNVQALVPPVL